MGLKEKVMQVAAGLFVERPARAKSLGAWKAVLEADGVAVDQRAAAAQDPLQASKVLRHISGIERWGQRRLKIFLGEPPIHDEYNDYRPGADLTLDEQRAFFRQTRAETVALAVRLQAAGIGDDARSPHNDFGPLSVRGWLRYLDSHANIESKKIR
ncbi:MAG: hypothetical protein IAE81_11645 [Caldilineaceae bacterium]|jgi:hypothetical protein|nr:hypothetical protein [Caldilineaceae bacterium]